MRGTTLSRRLSLCAALLALPSCVCAPCRCCPPCGPGRWAPTTVVARTAATEAKPPSGPAYATKGEKTTWDYLRGKYDKDADGRITPTEHDRGEAAFARLDADQDGVVTEKDFDRPNRMHVMVAQMYLMFYFRADEEPDTLALAELEQGFTRHDTDEDGRVTETELDAGREAMHADGTKSPIPTGFDPFPPMVDALDKDGDGAFSLDELKRFFASRDGDDDGVLRRPGRGPREPTGPAPGTRAPDFTLRPPGGGAPVTLSSFAGKQPVALIFGSWT